MHGPTLYEVLVVLAICTLTFLLPVVSRRRVEAFRYHPKYEELLWNYRFARRFSIVLLVLVLLLSLLSGKELERDTALTLLAGGLVFVYGIIWIAVNFTDPPNDYLDALVAMAKRSEVIGWWIGKGQRPEFIHYQGKVSFPRKKGCLFLSGMAVRNLETKGNDGRIILALVVFRATTDTKASEFQSLVSEVEKTLESAMQRLLDTGKDSNEIHQHLRMLEGGSLGSIMASFQHVQLYQPVEEIIGAQAQAA